MKRIIMMLTLAVLLVAALTITSAGAFANQLNKCEKDPDFKQCERFGPGESENGPAFGKNPNTGVERDTGQPD